MIDILNNYYSEIDAVDSGISFRNKLAELAKKYATDLEAQGNAADLKLMILENEIHNIQKSVSEGLQPLMRGTNEVNGKQIEVLIPDFTVYGSDEYNYIAKRYSETNNLFLKTEYGLMLFLNKRLQRNDQKLELCNHLINLTTSYKNIVFANEERWNTYVHVLYTRLVDTLTILYMGGPSLKKELDSFIQLIQNWFFDMPVNHPAFISFSQFIAQTFVDYKKYVKNTINKEKVIAKLDEGISHNELLDLRLAILIGEKALRFNESYSVVKNEPYHEKLGLFYEREGDAQWEKHPFGAAKSYEDAIMHLDKIEDKSILIRVKKKFEENKGKLQMGVVSVESNDEQSDKLTKWVAGVIERASIEEIISITCGYGLFMSAANLEANALKSSKQNLSINLFTTSFTDKFGNTLKVFDTPEKKLEYHRQHVANFNHNFAIQIMFKVLQRCMYEKIISFQNFKDVLEKSWLNEPVEWFSGGKVEKTIPLKAILPGIKYFFDEIEKRIGDDKYVPDMILCTDSLAPKIEMLLRYVCKKAGIPTFRYISNEGHLITEEKTLRDLTIELDGKLNPDDLILIKHLVNEKGGVNIRNHVAHGLIDAEDYSPAAPLTLIAIILRLALYQIPNKEVSSPIQ